jgi:hypothetical protein
MPEPGFGEGSPPDVETPATLERRRRSRGPAAGDLRRFSMFGTNTAKVVPLHGAASRPAGALEGGDGTTLRETLRAQRLERARRDFDFDDVEDAHRDDFGTLLDAYERCLYAGMDTDDLNDHLYRAYFRWDDGLTPPDPPDACD